MDIDVLFFLKVAICFLCFMAIVIFTKKVSIRIITLISIALLLGVAFYKTFLFDTKVSLASNIVKNDIVSVVENNRYWNKAKIKYEVERYLNGLIIDDCKVKVNEFNDYSMVSDSNIDMQFEVEFVIGRFYRVETLNICGKMTGGISVIMKGEN